MCARPRRVADHDLMDAAIRVATGRGAERTRLADVAVESGLAPATLVQRFGSREGLLDAISTALVMRVRQAFMRTAGSPVLLLRSALLTLAAESGIVFLIARPAGGATYSLELRKQIAFALASAIEAGELPHCDVAACARRVQLLYYGALVASLLEGEEITDSTMDNLLREVFESL